MVSAGEDAGGSGSPPVGPADPLPAPEPVDLRRVEARQREAEEFEALIRRVADGDDEALGTLFDRASARIYGLLLRMLGSPTQAATVTQEVFVEVWRQAARWNPSQGMVFAWIVAIAHQRGIDCIADNATASEPRPEPGNVSRAIDEVWAVIEQRFSSSRVRAGLRALDYVQRQTLLLAYFEGYSQQQVAAHLDIPLHSVRLRMLHGLVNLRRALGVSDD